MRTGLFGGSFNPPHLGHLIVAEAAREQGALDHVLWMPAALPPHKQDHTLAAPEHRLAMVQQATAGHPAFVPSDLELQRSGPSYTVDTLTLLHARHPETTWALILGGDSLQQFHTWHRPEAILELAHLLVYARPGTDLSEVEPAILDRTTVLDVPALLPLSSTDIRQRVRAGHSVRYLVPEAVRTYILNNALYT